MKFEGSQGQNIAIVGSGIAGLSAAWMIDRGHRVTVFEQESHIGGHSNTVDVAIDGRPRPIAVDTGFIVYNQRNYPNLTALFDHLAVATCPSNMSFAVSLDGGAFEYSGSGLRGLFTQPSNAVKPVFWRMVRDLLRFYREGPAILDDPTAAALTLGDYLGRNGYSRAFIDRHLLPLAAAVWSTPTEVMRQHPAQAFIRFNVNHGLMQLRDRPRWRTVVGGSRRYVARLTETFRHRIHVNAGVARIERHADGVEIVDRRGNRGRFDQVVIAAHADQALAMLAEPTADERALLGAFRYSANRTLLHRDASLMPRRRRAWSSWNYMGETRAGDDPRVYVSYWMNALQGLDPAVPLFVTLNPIREPAARSVLGEFQYTHPIYDVAAIAAQARLPTLQGHNRTWYCGSYFGAGFHEDALKAGIAVGEAISGQPVPWRAATPAVAPPPLEQAAA